MAILQATVSVGLGCCCEKKERIADIYFHILSVCCAAEDKHANTNRHTDTRTHVVEQIHDYDKYEMEKGADV